MHVRLICAIKFHLLTYLHSVVEWLVWVAQWRRWVWAGRVSAVTNVSMSCRSASVHSVSVILSTSTATAAVVRRFVIVSVRVR